MSITNTDYDFKFGPNGEVQFQNPNTASFGTMATSPSKVEDIDYAAMMYNSANTTLNPADYLNNNTDDKGMFSGLGEYLGGQKLSDISTAAGTAFGLYDNLFGNSSKIAKEQLGLLQEQRASNQQASADRKTFNSGWANASNGLASSYSADKVG